MKKYILFLITIMCFSTLDAQILYTENFNSYPIGNLGTDVTGTIPGQGGWYTLNIDFANPNYVNTNADYQIVPESNRGNILYLGYTNPVVGGNRHNVFRNDIKNIWGQRSTGNNVLKVSFDIFIQEANHHLGRATLYREGGELFDVYYNAEYGHLVADFMESSGFILTYSNGSKVMPPVNTWLTIEVYIDYDNSEAYISLPSLSYTMKETLKRPLLLQGGIDTEGSPILDDNPTKLNFHGVGSAKNIPNSKPFRLRIDNINIAAQNTVPVVTVGVNAVLSNSFNLYPNPAKNVVNITNNENRLVQQVAVYDTTGKLISTQSFTNEAEIQLNVENLASGTYMLHLITAEGIAVKKLVKK